MAAIYIVVTCDTKGHEADWLRNRFLELGVQVCLLDAGCLGTPQTSPDISREAVFRAAGTTHSETVRRGDRGMAVNAAARGAAVLVRQAFKHNELSGVIGLGGSAGTTIGTAAMRALPIGIPKIMLSTLTSGDVRTYVRDKDIVMWNPVVDIAGMNRISRMVLGNAAAAMAGMVKATATIDESTERPLIAATMFGVTTPCVNHARGILEDAGYEVLVFHATGTGGETLEALAREGLFAGVLDITTTEIADELVGGVLSAGPDRLSAAAEAGIPQVVSVGATDMVNFLARDTVPECFEKRFFYQHNANVTLMRTTIEESHKIGTVIGARVAKSKGQAALLLPLRGVSVIDQEGKPFHSPDARAALFEAVRQNCGSVPCIELDLHINDPEFAAISANKLLELIQEGS